jgi:hypothetical protein
MAVVILFAGNVFKTSISSYRIAAAQAEIMQKFRAITDQLNNDFRGLRKDAPLFIWFQIDPNNNRFDQIMFFADGDFQSTQIYNVNTSPGPYSGYIVPQPSGSPVVSNLARIYYSQARSIDPLSNLFNDPYNLIPANRILSRRQHLFIANPSSGSQYVQFPTFDSSGSLFVDPIQNNWLEHDTNSLSQWQAATQSSTNVNNIITGCFGTDAYYSNNRPDVNLTDASTLHLLMAQKVGNFSVQWGYYHLDTSVPPNRYVYWWPSNDPDGSGDITDSDFIKMMNVNGLSAPAFGVCFNVAAPSVSGWFTPNNVAGPYFTGTPGFYPVALKFTFTLYDSRGVFKDGQTFTHIVYLGD